MNGRGGRILKDMNIKPFIWGGVGYPCLELLYRGRTHPSMALCGAVCCAALCRIARGRGPLPLLALKGACAVTAMEYAVGMLFNRRHRIWDYRRLPGHVQGQVCPEFFAVWYLAAFGVIAAVRSGIFPRPRA